MEAISVIKKMYEKKLKINEENIQYVEKRIKTLCFEESFYKILAIASFLLMVTFLIFFISFLSSVFLFFFILSFLFFVNECVMFVNVIMYKKSWESMNEYYIADSCSIEFFMNNMDKFCNQDIHGGR